MNTLIFNSNFCQKNCQTSLQFSQIHILFKLSEKDKFKDFTQLNIYFVLLWVCNVYVHCDYKMFIIYIKDIEEVLNKKNKFNLKNIVFKEYHEFLNVFLLKKTEKLSLHWNYNYEIVLKKEKKLFFKLLYFMFCNELIMLKN